MNATNTIGEAQRGADPTHYFGFASAWSIADLALQPRMGLLPVGRDRLAPHRPAYSRVARQDLVAGRTSVLGCVRSRLKNGGTDKSRAAVAGAGRAGYWSAENWKRRLASPVAVLTILTRTPTFCPVAMFGERGLRAADGFLRFGARVGGPEPFADRDPSSRCQIHAVVHFAP